MGERYLASRPFFYLSKEPVKRLAHQSFVMPLHGCDGQHVAFDRFHDSIVAKSYGRQILPQILDGLVMRTVDHTRFEPDDAGETRIG